jgi:hypothetical protein
MKNCRTVLLALCCVSILAVVANAAPTPLVALTFDDAVASGTTTNYGSLGGVQQLPGGSNYINNDSSKAPTTVDSGNYMIQAGWVPSQYSTFSLPAMPSFTVSFWLNSVNVGGFRNIFCSNMASTVGQEFGAYTNGADLYMLGPGGTRYVVGAGVIPTAPNAWTNFAYSYDSAAGSMNLYVNGVDVTAGSVTGNWAGSVAAPDSTNKGMILAGTEGSSNLYGYLDNLFIFDSVLTQGQVQNLMTTNVVPEPATMILLAGGALGLLRRRK